MNLADMLGYADIDQLTRIARTYQCDNGSHSKNELIQSILSVIGRRESLESRMEEMNRRDLRFLNSLLFENRTAYSLEELKARAEDCDAGSPMRLNRIEEQAALEEKPRTQPKAARMRKKNAPAAQAAEEPEDGARQTITRFKQYGWLFNGFSPQTRYLFQVPEDIKRHLCEVLENHYRKRLDVRDEPPVYRDERGLLAEDLVVFLRYVRDNDIPLTSEGVMYKRQLGQVLELMSVEETFPGKAGWRFGYGRKFRDYPDRFSLLYDFAYYENLVQENRDRLIVTKAGRDAADGREKVDPAKLYRFWIRLYKGPVAHLEALVQWTARLAGNWTAADSLYDVLKPLIRPYYFDQEKDVLERRVLRMMMHLGLLRWGETAEGEAVIRMTPQGKAAVLGTPLPYEEALRLDDRSSSFYLSSHKASIRPDKR